MKKNAVATIKNGIITFVLLDDLNNEYQMTLAEYLVFAEESDIKTFFHSFVRNGAELTPYLLNNKYKSLSSTEKFGRVRKQYKRIDNEDGLTIKVEVKTKSKIIQFFDSKRILNFDADELAEAFEVDGSELQIIAKCLNIMHEEGHTANSISSCAFNFFLDLKFKSKNYSTRNMFRRVFPELDEQCEEFCRRSYRGGWVYLKEEAKGQRGFEGCTFDVNSLFPYVMYSKALPLYEPVAFVGKYEQDDNYPLFLQEVVVDWMKLKENKVPFLASDYFLDKALEDEYIVKRTKPARFILTNEELELMFESYDMGRVQYIKGYKFKASKVIFKEYIDHWGEVKKNNKGAKRQIAKLFLNSLYGRFAIKNKYKDIHFEIDEKTGIEKKVFDGYYTDDNVLSYVPLASFITSYARVETIKAANANYENLLYSDTDSIHLKCKASEVKGIKVHDSELGAWKLEKEFDDSIFLGLKCYAEHDKEGWEFKVAGLPQDSSNTIDINDFYLGAKVNYQVSAKTKTGSEIVEREFEIGKKMIGKMKFKNDFNL